VPGIRGHCGDALIRIHLVHKDNLWRGAAAAMLCREEDLSVVAESTGGDGIVSMARRQRPDIVVLDLPLTGIVPLDELCTTVCEVLPQCRILLVPDRPRLLDIGATVARLAPRIGLIAKDASPRRFMDGIRKLAAGEPVMDVELVMAAMAAGDNPLTCRERDVLRRAGEGASARDIAAELYLSAGTVRNYLARVVTKTGARTRLEAIRIAEQSGWI
jgi:two-component system, NarL family, response regulator DesR